MCRSTLREPLLLAFALGTAACRPDASVEPGASRLEPDEQTQAQAEPRYGRSVGPVRLYADPHSSAQQVEISASPSGAGRVFEVVEANPDASWSRVRTLSEHEAVALELPAGAGLAVLSLEGWVETAALHELDDRTKIATPPAAQPPSAMPTPEVDRRAAIVLRPGTTLRWPDGRVAGAILERHLMFTPATRRPGPSEDAPPLACHEHRRAPDFGAVEGWLCVNLDELDDGDSVDTRVALALDEPPTRSASEDPSGGPVRGALDRFQIREVVRRNIADIRDCYNLGLGKDPSLEGRVAIQFVISGAGTVSSALVSEDNLTDPKVGPCIAAKASLWEFPKPRGGGDVTVIYPFNLTPS